MKFKIGDLVKIRVNKHSHPCAPYGLVINSLNGRAFKIWMVNGTYTSKLASQLELISTMERS